MVFQPHLGRLAPRHQPEHPVRVPALSRRTTSVNAALSEAFGLFYAKPLQAIGLGAMWVLAWVVACLPAVAVDPLSYNNSNNMLVVGILGVEVPAEMAAVGVATVGLAFLGAPLLVGVYAAAIRSARQRAPTCKGLLTGFAHYPASFALGAAMGVVSAVLSLFPVVGAIAGFLLGVFMWVAMSALADRRAGVSDALNAALVLTGGRFLTLVLLNLAATVVILVGGLAACVGIVVGLPVAVLMLGVGYRDVVEAAGLADAESESAA
jgi:uncharacterized membrane protein